MQIIGAFFNVIVGAFFIWLGAFQLITAMLPHDFAMKVAVMHGEWMRENVFNLPPAKNKP